MVRVFAVGVYAVQDGVALLVLSEMRVFNAASQPVRNVESMTSMQGDAFVIHFIQATIVHKVSIFV